MSEDTAGKSYGGIDPGVLGALAIIRPDGSVEFFDPPVVSVVMTKKSKAGNERHRSEYVYAEAVRLIRDGRLAHVTIEKTTPMPSFRGGRMVPMPAASSFASGIGYGMWLTSCAAAGVPFQLVHPATWKAALMRDAAKTKEASVALAARLYPGASKDLFGPKGGMRDGRAEALLLAQYGLLGL